MVSIGICKFNQVLQGEAHRGGDQKELLRHLQRASMDEVRLMTFDLETFSDKRQR